MQGSAYYQRDKTRWRTLYWTVREIIQRTLAIILWNSFAASNSERTNYFFSRSFSVLFNFSTSVTCIKISWLGKKMHHNSDDSSDIIFRLILSVLLQFNIKLCNSSTAMAFIFWRPVSRPDDLFSLLKYGFVGVHQYSSLNTLLSYLQYWALQLDKLWKLKSGQI